MVAQHRTAPHRTDADADADADADDFELVGWLDHDIKAPSGALFILLSRSAVLCCRSAAMASRI